MGCGSPPADRQSAVLRKQTLETSRGLQRRGPSFLRIKGGILDQALWISWYDLPESGRDAYLAWVEKTYVPALLKRPGFLYGAHYRSVTPPGVPGGGRLSHTKDPSVGTGNAYIMVFGAEDAHAFARPTPRKLHAELSQADQKMLALRSGERVNILTEEARADGLDARKREKKAALSPCIQLGTFQSGTGEGDEDDLLAWYAQCRLPAMTRLTGCVGVRKIVSVSGWAKHGVLYEFVSVAERNKYFPDHEKGHPEDEAWTDRLVRKLLHAPGSPNVAERIASVVK